MSNISMKRALDFLLAAVALVILTAPLSLIALAVYLEDWHSPFYRGARIGRGGTPFHMLKFRSMRPDAWKSGVDSTAAGDSRITRVGVLLRRFKLDEVPQLWNVLLGEMSLVGPRPQVPPEVILYTRQECGLLKSRPGITDVASIVFADESEILAGAEDPDLLYNQIIRPWKSRLALAGIAHSSVFGDVRIAGLTLLGFFSRRRALAGVSRLLESWGAEAFLIAVARREAAPPACAPPGAAEIVGARPRIPAQRAVGA